jgi:hypothetical protein
MVKKKLSKIERWKVIPVSKSEKTNNKPPHNLTGYAIALLQYLSGLIL